MTCPKYQKIKAKAAKELYESGGQSTTQIMHYLRLGAEGPSDSLRLCWSKVKESYLFRTQ